MFCWFLRKGRGIVLVGLAVILSPVNGGFQAMPACLGGIEPALVQAELIPERLWVEPGKPFNLWLRLRIEPGWHIYWKNPGDSGLPTMITWKLPVGVSLFEMHWPWPEKILSPLATSYGYENQVLFLARFFLSFDTAFHSSFPIGAAIDYLACREGCLPGSCSSEITLEVRKQPAPENEKYRGMFLAGLSGLAVKANNWKTRAKADEAKIRIFFQPPEGDAFNLLGADFFIEEEGIIDYATAEKWEKEASWSVLSLTRASAAEKLPTVINGILVLNPAFNQERKIAFSLRVPLEELK